MILKVVIKLCHVDGELVRVRSSYIYLQLINLDLHCFFSVQQAIDGLPLRNEKGRLLGVFSLQLCQVGLELLLAVDCDTEPCAQTDDGDDSKS